LNPLSLLFVTRGQVRACMEHGSKSADGAGFLYRLGDTEVKVNAAGAVQVST
jgi:hypothetical protein